MKTKSAVKGFIGAEIFNFSIDQNKKTVFLLNFSSLGLLALATVGMIFLIKTLRPEALALVENPTLTVISLLASIPVKTTLHELIHGVAFWMFTKEKPEFGFKIWYAYAAAPDWYFPRWQYVLAVLCPLALITIAGLIILPILHLNLIPFLFIVVVTNVSSSIGDIFIAAKTLLAKEQNIMVNDYGKGASFFVGSDR